VQDEPAGGAAVNAIAFAGDGHELLLGDQQGALRSVNVAR